MGGVAGGIAKTGSAPIERVKLLIQNQGAMLKSGRLASPYKGIVDCMTRTYQTEGLWSRACPSLSPYLSYARWLTEAIWRSLAWQWHQRHPLLPHASTQLLVQGASELRD